MSEPADPALDSLFDLVFDAACERPLSAFVDADRLVAALDVALEPERLTYWQTRLLVPMRTRVLARLANSKTPLRAALPPEVSQGLLDLAGRPAHIPRKFVDDFVASDQVRETVKTMLQDSLTSFVSKAVAPAEPGAKGAGLRDAFSWGARAAGAVGKGLLGGLGAEVQRQLQDRVRDFVDGSVASLQRKLADKLASDETAAELGRRRRKALEGLLAKTEADVAKTVAKAPHATIDPVIPRVVHHNVTRAENREMFRDEVAAAVTELSKSTVGELLERAGIKDQMREALRAHGTPFARALLRSTAFADWWKQHRAALDAAASG